MRQQTAPGAIRTTRASAEAPAQNRSLARGIEVLRAFRQGVDLLGNGEIAERTGLSPATVSRLTQTLVAAGMLEHVASERAYRLGPPVLALAHALRVGSPILNIAGPIMRAVAERHRVNVGLAAPDRDAMVYLESFRYNRRPSLRQIVAGQRIPIELTSLGRACLAAQPERQRRIHLQRARKSHGAGWLAIAAEIDAAIADIAAHGFCWAAWQPGVVAVATPLMLADGRVLALNISAGSDRPAATVAQELAPVLLRLRAKLMETFEAQGAF